MPMDSIHSKFIRNKEVALQATYFYPIGAERELRSILRKFLKQHREDAKGPVKTIRRAMPYSFSNKKDLYRELDRIGKRVGKAQLSSFHRAYKKTFGTDITVKIDYDSIVDGWAKEVSDFVQEEKPENIKAASRVAVTRLNGRITKETHEKLGIHKYKWVTQGDERVRQCHAALNGRIFSWKRPPMMWRISGGKRVFTGRKCHPGEDYGCRCFAIPVLNEEEAIKLCETHGRKDGKKWIKPK